MPLGKIVTTIDIDQALEVAVTAAEAAGTLLRERVDDNPVPRTKSATGDVVTDLDLASEQLIVDQLRCSYPGHQIIAEESGRSGSDDEWTWLVDPLDGTNNVAIGLRAYMVGIALCHRKLPLLGVVHDPIARRTWSAARTRGTRGPEGPLAPVPYRPRPHRKVLAWTQGYGVNGTDQRARALRLVLESASRRVLQLWAPLLCWVMLARGDIDGFVGYRAEAVDLPAGILIAREAGAVVRTLDGAPYDEAIDIPEDQRSFVAGHPDVIPELLALVRAADDVTVTGLGLGRRPVSG